MVGVGLAVIVGKTPIMVDVGYEQRDWPSDGTRLGYRDRGGVDEGVVSSEAALLVEKNGRLLRERATKIGGRSDNRKITGSKDAREKRLCLNTSTCMGVY
jgi:hypothetical protein